MSIVSLASNGHLVEPSKCVNVLKSNKVGRKYIQLIEHDKR